MPRLQMQTNVTNDPSQTGEIDKPAFRHVLACLDHSPEMRSVLGSAVAIAEIAGARLTVLRVVPIGNPAASPVDPVDWDLECRHHVAQLWHLIEDAHAPEGTDAVVVGGSVPQEICDLARSKGMDLAVLGSGARIGEWGLGGTVRHVAERFSGSVMVVPPELAGAPKRARRVLVPLDGSAQAETALRLASRIACNRDAELVLLHATADIGLEADALPQPEDQALLTGLRQRAEAKVVQRLDRIRSLLPAGEVRSRVRQIDGDEPRRALSRAICEERGELVVLTARGCGSDPDLPIGSTADYLLSRAMTPMLLFRQGDNPAALGGGTAPIRASPVAGRRQ